MNETNLDAKLRVDGQKREKRVADAAADLHQRRRLRCRAQRDNSGSARVSIALWCRRGRGCCLSESVVVRGGGSAVCSHEPGQCRKLTVDIVPVLKELVLVALVKVVPVLHGVRLELSCPIRAHLMVLRLGQSGFELSDLLGRESDLDELGLAVRELAHVAHRVGQLGGQGGARGGRRAGRGRGGCEGRGRDRRVGGHGFHGAAGWDRTRALDALFRK